MDASGFSLQPFFRELPPGFELGVLTSEPPEGDVGVTCDTSYLGRVTWRALALLGFPRGGGHSCLFNSDVYTSYSGALSHVTKCWPMLAWRRRAAWLISACASGIENVM